jgi:hypothetical protein
MFIFILLLSLFLKTNSYPFCPNCIHFTKTGSTKTPNCDLFKTHPLYKDMQDVDFLGKEICGEKGKYFISGTKLDKDGEMTIYEQNTQLFQGRKKLKK